ncbi:hypothetical protein LOZ61_004413 [Ophidiomyces ophidiicola]|nr:hypothetical protein LOZ61_004413 [Ophidiomyces ophidiicola]KAI1920412.1 hypothetical protein LOZ60_006585 [Ophidiomyces ophidiicola]KAI1966348.1 hypothetical protein LOZ56_005824 [Ophidiomyces ophidiicola]KAI2003832.1 hypothetical protein LOZ49_006101 [Ophidiomyces ophidiicola]KAI2028271.1 hypothetical protein LOZ48_004315 [Ophidiomyces ophidiicola]
MATPHRSSRRQSPESNSALEPPSEADQTITLPPYQPQSHQLNVEARQAIRNLAESEQFRLLATHLGNLAQALTDTVGEVNDQLNDANARYQKQKRKRDNPKDGEDGDPSEGQPSAEAEKSDKHIADLQMRVKMTTEKMEQKIRGVIDAEFAGKTAKEILEKISQPPNAGRPSAQSRRRTKSGRRKRTECDGNGEGNEGEGSDGDGNSNAEHDDEEQRYDPVASTTYLFETQVQEKLEKWKNASLTERYTNDNTYIGFYRVMHESRHPGDDVPPLPNRSTWFSHMEDPPQPPQSHPTRRTRKRASRIQSDDEDIAVESERISTRCPITYLPFNDPVSSTKCPHTFERAAIEDMINNSSDTITTKTSTGRRKVKCVKCPVCSAQLILENLRHDPAMQRRVRRAIENETMQDDEEMDENEDDEQDVVLARRQTSRSQNVAVKLERPTSRERSIVPGTQFETIIDDGEEEGRDVDVADTEEDEEKDDEDEEEEEEEEEEEDDEEG